MVSSDREMGPDIQAMLMMIHEGSLMDGIMPPVVGRP
jgi:hypothetical protein